MFQVCLRKTENHLLIALNIQKTAFTHTIIYTTQWVHLVMHGLDGKNTAPQKNWQTDTFSLRATPVHFKWRRTPVYEVHWFSFSSKRSEAVVGKSDTAVTLHVHFQCVLACNFKTHFCFPDFSCLLIHPTHLAWSACPNPLKYRHRPANVDTFFHTLAQFFCAPLICTTQVGASAQWKTSEVMRRRWP